MTDALEAALQELRREYLLEAPARLAQLRREIAAFRAGEPDAITALRTHFHRLAGSGGSYGFSEISEIARGMGGWLTASPPPDRAAAELDDAVDRLARAFDRAAETIATPPDG